MVSVWQKLSILFVIAMTCAACTRVEPVYNVEDAPVPVSTQQKLSSEQVGKIIAKAALEKGWTATEVKPGLLHCTLQWHGHIAIVDITYSRKDYSIELDSSQNLKESDGMIHRKYNERVQELQNEIDKKLSQIAYN
jgi:hypothetical protein